MLRIITNLLDRLFSAKTEPPRHRGTPLERIHEELAWPQLRNEDFSLPANCTTEEYILQSCIQQIQNYRDAIETAFLIVPKEERDAIRAEMNWRMHQ